MKILVTGAAGFIGYHLVKSLLEDEIRVVGIDNLNSYYDPELKKLRLKELFSHPMSNFFSFEKIDISNRKKVSKLFLENNFDVVINLAAQAGVRYSIENPNAYIDSNIIGFANILEESKKTKIKHLIFASSSSVYGKNNKMPFNEGDNVDYPISLYAASKKSNELMAYSYSHLFNIPCTGLRFFTVYGPYGRPDMAYYSFMENIINNKKINVFNNGNMKRDFTYIDDVVEGIKKVIPLKPKLIKHTNTNATARYKIYNIGNNKPITLNRFIKAIEKASGKKAKRKFLPMQLGDVPITYADITNLGKDVNFSPKTTIEIGIEKFYEWFVSYKKQKKE